MEDEIFKILKRGRNGDDRTKRLYAQAIAAHVMEFMEWIGSEELYFEKGYWLLPDTNSVYGEIIRKTTEELYQYWVNEVKIRNNGV